MPPPPKWHLLISIIAYKKQIDYEVTDSIEAALPGLAMMGWRAQRFSGGGSADLAGCRNTHFAVAHAGPFTHMLFIDSDVWWEPGSIERLVSHDVDLILGAYPRRKAGAGFAIRTLPGPQLLVNPKTGAYDPQGILEIAGGPSGMMLISRACMEKMVTSYSDLWYADPEVSTGKSYNLFEFAVRDHERMGEDLHFCRMFRAVGGRVWTDPHLKLHHNGDTTFSGCFADHLRQMGRLVDPGKVQKVPVS